MNKMIPPMAFVSLTLTRYLCYPLRRNCSTSAILLTFATSSYILAAKFK